MIKKLQVVLKNPSNRRWVIAASVLFIILLFITSMRIWAVVLLRYNTNQQAVPVVKIIHATKGQLTHDIVLPGTISAWHEASIYARTSGYIKNWYVDIGDTVTTGQILAEIEAPELDAQLHQAKAKLNVALAQNTLAQLTAKRWLNLVKSDWVSKQATDEKIDSAKAFAATVIAEQAAYKELETLVNFENVTAPFSGIITARDTDIGALINAGHNPESKPLFRLVQNDPLRLYVNIPQNYSSQITPQLQVNLIVEEHPGQLFKATLLETAKAIDPKTGTLLAQFIVQNKEGRLLPGSYTQVHFSLNTPSNTIRLPVNTMLFRAEGLQVATVDKSNRVRLKTVTMHRDFGREVEISSGINPGDRVIINPSDSIVNGERVRVSTK